LSFCFSGCSDWLFMCYSCVVTDFRAWLYLSCYILFLSSLSFSDSIHLYRFLFNSKFLWTRMTSHDFDFSFGILKKQMFTYCNKCKLLLEFPGLFYTTNKHHCTFTCNNFICGKAFISAIILDCNQNLYTQHTCMKTFCLFTCTVKRSCSKVKMTTAWNSSDYY